jgi:hypothetical protein
MHVLIHGMIRYKRPRQVKKYLAQLADGGIGEYFLISFCFMAIRAARMIVASQLWQQPSG